VRRRVQLQPAGHREPDPALTAAGQTKEIQTMKKALIGIAVAAGLVLAAPAGAAVREVPQDFPTIQDAVDAANPGDTIAISKKRNLENVSVATESLLIRGTRPGVFVDGYINGSGNGPQFDIAADGVRIVNLGIKNGEGIYCSSYDGCVAKKLRYSGLVDDYCFYSSGERARVIGSTLVNCDSEAVYIQDDDAVVRNNVIRRSDSGCVDIGGDDAVVKNNRITACEDDDAIYISGDRALAQDNFVHGADGNIVEISGDGGRILGNRGDMTYGECYYLSGDRGKVRNNVGISCDDDGMYVSGEDPQVTGNRLSLVNDYGIDFECSVSCGDAELSDNVVNETTEDDTGIYVSVSTGTGSALIARNRVTAASQDGIDISTLENGRVVDNVVNGAGLESEVGFNIDGDDNTFVGNRVLNAKEDAFYITGSDNVLEENVARGNGGDGFQVLGGYLDNVLVRNVAIGNGADGIENDGTDTVLRKNRSSGNHRDCANDGTIAVKQGNQCADGSNFNLPGTASRVRP
jgi:parallel beta-helix repeat protein